MRTQAEQECRSRSRTHAQENGAKHYHSNMERDSRTTPSWLVVLVEETRPGSSQKSSRPLRAALAALGVIFALAWTSLVRYSDNAAGMSL